MKNSISIGIIAILCLLLGLVIGAVVGCELGYEKAVQDYCSYNKLEYIKYESDYFCVKDEVLIKLKWASSSKKDRLKQKVKK